jgi:uncharacterized coiled-coil protein SlyX
MKTLHLRKSIDRSLSSWCGFLLIPLLLGCFALSPTARAVLPSPTPDGAYPGFNTAEGGAALFSLTTGQFNTANGSYALYHNTTGSNDIATGAQALYFNTTGHENTAIGVQALYHNTTSKNNAATGLQALFSNTIGNGNTADGEQALYGNTTGSENTATGHTALLHNTGSLNTADGAQALLSNTTGADSTAIGWQALVNNTVGTGNTAIGKQALGNNTTGSYNTAVGEYAGTGTNGNYNVYIGGGGVAGDNQTIRIGSSQAKTYIAGIGGTFVTGGPVYIGANGQLGQPASSARFKGEIKPMDKASEAILALKPVTFRYKKELDPKGTPQFGLVAEEVEKVNPDLIARDAEGKPYTVRYEAVNAMLLNEFLEEHRKVEGQAATISQLKSTVAEQNATIAQQQKGMEAVTARLNEQAAQIQKVSAQLEASKPAPHVVNNP